MTECHCRDVEVHRYTDGYRWHWTDATGRSPESTKAYQTGLRVDCKTEPHSAGRPRCEKCHTKFRRGE